MANGTTIVNYPTGYTILRSDYVGSTANDLYSRFLVESAVMPCIYSGLVVTVNSGLIATVSAGYARGDNIQFNSSVNTPFLPTVVGLATPTNVTCTNNSSGWIVLNVNIDPDPLTTNSDTYDVVTDNGSALPQPVFVTSLTPGPSSTYPYTQIVLAAVTTLSGAITVIDMTGLSNRSFDYNLSLANYLASNITIPATFTQGAFSGIAPAVASALTRKDYVDAALTSGQIILPGGLIIKYGTETISSGIATGTLASNQLSDYSYSDTITFGGAFPTACFYAGIQQTSSPSTTGDEEFGQLITSLSSAAFNYTLHCIGGGTSTAPPANPWSFMWWAIGN